MRKFGILIFIKLLILIFLINMGVRASLRAPQLKACLAVWLRVFFK
jgi:hypothetical protein